MKCEHKYVFIEKIDMGTAKEYYTFYCSKCLKLELKEQAFGE